MTENSHPRTRRTVPVIAPTEWIQFQPEHAVLVAEWLAERGVHCELAYRGGSYPTLWRGAAIGRDSVKPGQWVGVQNPGYCVVVDDDVLDDSERYRHLDAAGRADTEESR